MPAIADCPKCEKQISLPRSTDPNARVRCPLCDEEYLLEDALATAPPELILLDVPEPAATTAGSADDSFASWGDGDAGSSDIHGSGIGLAEAPSGASSGFDFGDEPAGEGVPGDMPKMAPLPGPRKRRSSFLRQMIGVFGGGVIGLGLGYFILLWVGGPRKDFLEIGHKLPSFMVPAEFHGGGPDNDDQGPAPETGQQSDTSNKDSQDGDDADGPDFSQFNDKFGVTPSDPNEQQPPDDKPQNEPDAIDPPSDAKPVAAVIGAPNYQPAELGAALKAANDKVAGLTELSLADADQRAEKLAAFKAFCELGEKVTFVQGDSGGLDQLASRRTAIRRMATRVADEATSLDDIGRMADGWIKSPNRTSSGIFLVGDVESVESVTTADVTVHVTKMTPTGQQSSVKVVTAQPPPWMAADQVVVLGSIVAEPLANIIGYDDPGGDGTESVVWAGMPIKLAN